MIQAKKLVHDFVIQEEDGKEEIFRALNGIDIEIKEGSFVAVLGHNGSGKSTFAKHLNAFLFPTSGTITVKDMETTNAEHLWDIRKTVGMVFQNPDNQIIGTIVEEDTAFGPENLGIPTEKISLVVQDALQAVRMEEYAKHSPNKLSGGQKQRIAIAGVLAMKPECIVFDEPTAMLDPKGRKEVIQTIKRLNREGITVVLITHYMEEAIAADYVFVIEHGNIALQGTPAKVFSNVEIMKSLGLDVPQIAELSYRLRLEGYPVTGEEMTIEEMVEVLCRLKSKI